MLFLQQSNVVLLGVVVRVHYTISFSYFSEEESLFSLGDQFGGTPKLISYFGIKANSFHSPTTQFHPVTALFSYENLQWGSCRVLEGEIFGEGINISLERSIGGGTFSLGIIYFHLHPVLFLICYSYPTTLAFFSFYILLPILPGLT